MIVTLCRPHAHGEGMHTQQHNNLCLVASLVGCHVPNASASCKFVVEGGDRISCMLGTNPTGMGVVCSMALCAGGKGGG